MYQLLKNNTVQYILQYKPTAEALDDLECDSYSEYINTIEIEEKKKARIYQSLVASSNIGDVDLE